VTNAKSGKIPDWSWSEKDMVEVKRATKREIGFQMKVAENYERKGGNPINVDSTATLKNLVGFRDIQSGNWVLDDPNSAKFHVEQTAGAMMDLGDMLGIDTHSLGIGGRLGMAFGARGTGSAGWKSGAARAHYESVHRVINLTKMGGGGTVGHEWFHSIDDMLGELTSGVEVGVARNYSSENPDVLPPGAVKDAMQMIRKVMMTGDIRMGESIKITDKDRKVAELNFRPNTINPLVKKIVVAGNLVDALIELENYFAPYQEDRFSDKSRKKNMRRWNEWKRITVAYYTPGAGDEKVYAKSGRKVSSFMAEAVRLDAGEINKYWSTPVEMAARAFQSYIEDKLAENDRKNDYLSVYADNKYHYDAVLGIQWNPYPEGDERTRINAAFDKFFAAIRDEKVFEKAISDTKLMDAIFNIK